MNEWNLQHELSKKYIKEKFIFEHNEYDLVLWELMFPSWRINDNRGKWNEPSIDFIFYSEKKKEFLCVELKNVLKGKKNLLSAYYQTAHRTIKFIEQYNSNKITKARASCFKYPINERGGIEKNLAKINFDNNPNFRSILLANSFPKYYKEKFNNWNNLSFVDLKKESLEYSENKEIVRFNNLTEKQFSLLALPIKAQLILES